MKYYKAQSSQDFLFLSNLLTKKNYKFIETPSVSTKEIKERNKKPNQADYILKIENKKIGWFMIKLTNKQARFGLILKHTYQNKGYGKQAMKLIEKESKKLGVKKIRLEVLEGNPRALNLYLKSGFKEKYRLVVMEKNIK